MASEGGPRHLSRPLNCYGAVLRTPRVLVNTWRNNRGQRPHESVWPARLHAHYVNRSYLISRPVCYGVAEVIPDDALSLGTSRWPWAGLMLGHGGPTLNQPRVKSAASRARHWGRVRYQRLDLQWDHKRATATTDEFTNGVVNDKNRKRVPRRALWWWRALSWKDTQATICSGHKNLPPFDPHCPTPTSTYGPV